jgi:hypothetical protein
VPVNGYRWFRGFNDFDNWQAFGRVRDGRAIVYYPAKGPHECATVTCRT